MRFLFLALVACVSANVHVRKLFGDWMKEHGKVYATQEEAIRRYDNFMTNLAWISQRNTELEFMTVGLNEFADMTEEEFAGIYLHPINSTEYHADVAANAIPQDINNIPINGKCETAVRNQGQCGSCWASSAAGALDGLLCLSSEENYAWTSTQELVDCCEGGCNGGWPKNALSYYKSKGICLDSEYTYHSGTSGKKGSCQSSKCKHSGINSIASCQDKGGGITSALSGNMVSICIDASGLDFMFYKSGSFMPGVNCNKHSVNHAVLAVSASGDNYRVKNSWGTSWGASGYFTMPAGVNCLAVNANPSVYPQ